MANTNERGNAAKDASHADPVVGNDQGESTSTTPRALDAQLANLVDGAPSWRMMDELDDQLRRFLLTSQERPAAGESTTHTELRSQFQESANQPDVLSFQDTSSSQQASSPQQQSKPQQRLASQDSSKKQGGPSIDMSKAPKGPRNWRYNRRKGPPAKQQVETDTSEPSSGATSLPRPRRKAKNQPSAAEEVYDEEWRANFPDQEESELSARSRRVIAEQADRVREAQEAPLPEHFHSSAGEFEPTIRIPSQPAPQSRQLLTIPNLDISDRLVDGNPILQALNDIEHDLRGIGRQHWRREALAAGRLHSPPTYQKLRAEVLRRLEQRQAIHQQGATAQATQDDAPASPAGSDATVRPARGSWLYNP